MISLAKLGLQPAAKRDVNESLVQLSVKIIYNSAARASSDRWDPSMHINLRRIRSAWNVRKFRHLLNPTHPRSHHFQERQTPAHTLRLNNLAIACSRPPEPTKSFIAKIPSDNYIIGAIHRHVLCKINVLLRIIHLNYNTMFVLFHS